MYTTWFKNVYLSQVNCSIYIRNEAYWAYKDKNSLLSFCNSSNGVYIHKVDGKHQSKLPDWGTMKKFHQDCYDFFSFIRDPRKIRTTSSNSQQLEIYCI